jgi:hypothetical protein
MDIHAKPLEIFSKVQILLAPSSKKNDTLTVMTFELLRKSQKRSNTYSPGYHNGTSSLFG